MTRAGLLLGVLMAFLPLGGCQKPAPGPAPRVAGDADARPTGGPLPSRPEVVALADQLAVRGSRLGGKEGAVLTRSAADLRARMWRLEHRQADALEAVELYRSLSTKHWAGACRAKLDQALLEGEIESNPVEAYRAVYLARGGADPACRRDAEAALVTLAAFKPLPSVLAELDRSVGATTSTDGGVDASHPGTSNTVIVPQVSATPPKGPVRITAVERYGAQDAARVVVFVTHPTLFQVGFIERQQDRGPRLYVDIDRAKYQGKLELDVGGIVQRVRMGQQKKGTRVVLDLEKPVHRRVFYLPEPYRLVIDVSTTPAESELGDGGTRPVRRVVLDPGHGGHDPGATGPGGLREKDVTLDVAHRAAPLIARELGVATLLTRDGDDYVSLDERTARANAFNADLFVSIHCNASENPDGHGVMTFVLAESREAFESQIAARENAASPAAAELATALSGSVSGATRSRSLRFAQLLQRATAGSLETRYGNVRDRGVRRAGFYVLAGARMPAVLYEASFISNPEEEALLDTPDFRQKLADSIVNAVRAYRDGK